MESKEYQTVIVGAGIAGFSAAIEAYDRGSRVVLRTGNPRSGHQFWRPEKFLH